MPLGLLLVVVLFVFGPRRLPEVGHAWAVQEIDVVATATVVSDHVQSETGTVGELTVILWSENYSAGSASTKEPLVGSVP